MATMNLASGAGRAFDISATQPAGAGSCLVLVSRPRLTHPTAHSSDCWRRPRLQAPTLGCASRRSRSNRGDAGSHRRSPRTRLDTPRPKLVMEHRGDRRSGELPRRRRRAKAVCAGSCLSRLAELGSRRCFPTSEEAPCTEPLRTARGHSLTHVKRSGSALPVPTMSDARSSIHGRTRGNASAAATAPASTTRAFRMR